MKKLSLLIALGLCACGSPTFEAPRNTPVTPPNPPAVTLCVSNDCGAKTTLATIPDAENQIFTDDGRLFVSGGTNVFEITESAGDYIAAPIASSDCNFTGLAIQNNYLYANCADGTLFGGAITTNTLIEPIYNYVGVSFANGMAVDSSGRLYTVDGPVSSSGLPTPKIVRLIIDASDPSNITSQETWLNNGLSFPNGLAFADDTFYFTDSQLLPVQAGAVRSVPLNPDGSAGAVTTVRVWNSILDDLSVLPDGRILIADFQSGLVALLTADGTVEQQTTALTFSSATSVQLGQPPLFSNTDVLVTEKGILGDTSSNTGNVLSVFRAN